MPHTVETAPRLTLTDPRLPDLLAAGKIRVTAKHTVFCFRCACGGHFRTLHAADDGEFRCRRCLSLTYESPNELRHRSYALAGRLREKLGGEPSALAPLPPRPARMRLLRYARIVMRIRKLEGHGLERLKRLNGALAKLAGEESP